MKTSGWGRGAALGEPPKILSGLLPDGGSTAIFSDLVIFFEEEPFNRDGLNRLESIWNELKREEKGMFNESPRRRFIDALECDCCYNTVA